MRLYLTLTTTGILITNAFGQVPVINNNGLMNNYSNVLPGLPNYGIAEGSIFQVYGTDLSPTTVPLQSKPQANLSGVSITVTVNGTTTHPLIYSLSPGQIDAILPSDTPVGTGTISVTTSAGTSATIPIQVVQSDFGLLTTNNGSGPVAGFDANNNGALLGYGAAANPGEILELWGTGLGPVTNDATDVAVSPAAQVFIGGVAAKVLYAGRSSYPGLDQINVQVPMGVTGCNVSVVVQTGNYVSNFGTLAVAANGRTCTDTANPISASLQNQIAQSGTANVGVIALNESTTPTVTIAGVSTGGTMESAFAAFFKMTAAQFNAGASFLSGATTSAGSCAVNFFNTTAATTSAPFPFQFTYLNAGPDINVMGPEGLLTMPLTSNNGMDVYLAPSTAGSFLPASGGTFTFDNGSGGPDVGAFTAKLTVPSPLAWSNMNDISTVTRGNGVTVNWTGGDPGTYVAITGASLGTVGSSTTDFVVGNFTCLAPASAGMFTVPSNVLVSLPTSTQVDGISYSTLSVSNVVGLSTFTAPGLDLGLVEATVGNTINVAYQ